jgi:hypothetical protein
MTKRNSMTTLTRWVLGHKKLIVGLWLVLAIAGFAAIKPAGDALSTSFNIPGSEAFSANSRIAKIYGNGGDVPPIVAVVTLPKGSSVDSPGVARELTAALAKVKTALPHARLASYASTHDRAFVSKDGHTRGRSAQRSAPGTMRHRRLRTSAPEGDETALDQRDPRTRSHAHLREGQVDR